MEQFVAFLRSINVGGKNLIKMDQLSKTFEMLGFKNLRTYIQSGNVIFDSKLTDEKLILSKTEKELHKLLSKNVILVVRHADEIKLIVKSNPFLKIKFAPSTKLYVSLLKDDLKQKPKLPILSDKKDVEIFHITKREIYSITSEINGRFGFPNNFVEEVLKVSATTRNWNTILKISELINN